MRSQQLIAFAAFGVLFAVAVKGMPGQNSASNQTPEQTLFEAEADSPVKHPAKIPDSALQALRDTLTGGTFNCLKARGVTPDQAPASWFLASEIHLNGQNEIDLVVIPNTSEIEAPSNPGGCLLAAHGGRFWILGPGIASGRYELLLGTYGFSLQVLNSRTNRYRDIQVGEGTVALLYKFALQQYQLAERKAEP